MTGKPSSPKGLKIAGGGQSVKLTFPKSGTTVDINPWTKWFFDINIAQKVLNNH